MSPEAGGRHVSAQRPVLPRQALGGIAVLVTVLVVVALALTRGHGGDDSGSRPGEPVTATPDEITGVAAEARTMLTTWARPGTTYAEWWRDLKPLLSPAAQQAYSGTDTALLPDLGELTEPEVVTGISPDTTTVWFETGEGRFGVDLSRTAQGQPWRMVRVLFPGQKSTFQ